MYLQYIIYTSNLRFINFESESVSSHNILVTFLIKTRSFIILKVYERLLSIYFPYSIKDRVSVLKPFTILASPTIAK